MQPLVIHTRRVYALTREEALTQLLERELLTDEPVESHSFYGHTRPVLEAFRVDGPVAKLYSSAQRHEQRQGDEK